MKIEIAKKDLSNVKSVISSELVKAEMKHQQFYKGKNGKLCFRSPCDCGRHKLVSQGIDFVEANRNQIEYIAMLNKLNKRLYQALTSKKTNKRLIKK